MQDGTVGSDTIQAEHKKAVTLCILEKSVALHSPGYTTGHCKSP